MGCKESHTATNIDNPEPKDEEKEVERPLPKGRSNLVKIATFRWSG